MAYGGNKMDKFEQAYKSNKTPKINLFDIKNVALLPYGQRDGLLYFYKLYEGVGDVEFRMSDIDIAVRKRYNTGTIVSMLTENINEAARAWQEYNNDLANK